MRRQELAGPRAPADALIVINPSLASEDRLTLEVIRGLEYLPERYRLATLEGPGTYYRVCQEEVRALGLEDRVVFLPRMPFDRLMEYVASADLGIVFQDGRGSSGHYMANPIRLSQFAACGLPFVASDSPTLAGDVYRYGLGLCCDALEPRAIARALRELAEGEPSLEQRRIHVRRQFEQALHFEVRGEHLATALRQLLARS
jgi:glycosyltransferase involved in cell wall biosynthesis